MQGLRGAAVFKVRGDGFCDRASLGYGDAYGIEHTRDCLDCFFGGNVGRLRGQFADERCDSIAASAQFQLRGFLQADREEYDLVVSLQFFERKILAYDAAGAELDPEIENVGDFRIENFSGNDRARDANSASCRRAEARRR